MNIMYCGDSGAEKGIALSALSLCKHTKHTLCLYILTASVGKHTAISPSFADKLQKAVNSFGRAHTVILYDITENFSDYLPKANLDTRFTPLCMLRLFADTVPQIPDKLLYLDTDVMCRAEFAELYKTDLKGAEIAGVPDRYGKWFFGNIFKHNYLNSGVLLMDMQKIKQSKLFLKCRTLCRDKKMFMPDQTALNKLAKKIKLPRKYNCQGKILKDTVFKHFTTYFEFLPYIHPVTVKPWSSELHTKLNIYEFDDIIELEKELMNYE